MLQPAGAMALFVLRLAGLLSLEESLNELQANNLTSSIYNLSDTITPRDYGPRDSAMNLNFPRELEVESSDDDTNNNGNAGILTNSLNSQRPNLSRNGPVKSQNNRRQSNVGGIDAADWTASRKQQLSISTGKRKGRYRNQGVTSAPRASPLSDVRHLTFPPISVSDEFGNSGNSNDTNLRNIELHDEVPTLSSTEQSSPNQVKQININESRERPQINSPDSHTVRLVDRSQASDDVLENNTQTSNIFAETLVTSNSVKAVPVAKIPVVQDDSNGYEQHRNIQPHKINSPHMEAIAEGEDLFDDVHDHRLVGLESPPDTFVGRDFEYYDFRNRDHSSDQTSPSLSSRSLISAVPPGRSPRIRQNQEPTREEEPTMPNRRHGIPPAQPVPRPSFPANTARVYNNPYPYGPKILPSPYNPHAAPYSPPAPYDPMGRDRNGEREPEPSPEYDYEEYYDYDHIDAEEKYTVHTSEPTVLFHFEKPGYTPEAPTTLMPVTRAPTPSDPWDCAPRCPTYTLLDWNTDYDVRLYPNTMWVSTVIISENRVLAELEGYMRVQDYFYGLNDKGLVLNLTVPFVTQIKFGKHPGVLHESNDFTISLYIPPRYYEYDDPPTPISNEVLIDELEEKTVFVHSFEANVWDVTEKFLKEKANTLMEKLRKNGEAFLDRYYYLASYSRPELYQPVYYELWVYATNFRDPQITGRRMSPNRLPLANKITEKTMNKLCRGVECPNFEVLRTYKYGIQKRRYYDGLFASTSPNECEYTTMSVWKGFMPLHLYKHGINSHMEVIEATRPIALVHILESTEPNTECPQNMTMSLYLPRRLHSNPPITGYAAPNVRITEMNDVIVYAYTVGGYLLDPLKMRKELADMKYRLSEFGACYKDHDYYIVVYDFIVRYHGRQNEIWIVAENCKATHNG